jgi:hypothetical protein
MHEYGTLKPVEAILRSRGRGRKMEEMNQTMVHCLHIWHYHIEPPEQLLCSNKKFFKKEILCQALVAHACNPSYSIGGSQLEANPKQIVHETQSQKKKKKTITKKKGLIE